MPIRPRAEIEHLAPVPHGGFASRQPAHLLDFSANVNPFGPSSLIWEAMREVRIGQHPDPRAAPLVRALADSEGLAPRHILVGNGSVDLIYRLAVAYVRAGDRVLIVGPTFGEYASATAIMGAEVMTFRALPEQNFEVDLQALLHFAISSRPRLIFLCNPNNPTGTYLHRVAVEQLLRGCPDSLLVLDEAFVRFIADAWDSHELLTYDNLLVLRSLTKDYALTALRVGYAIGAAGVIEALAKVQPPWSVNAFGQAASIAALRDQEHLRTSLDQLRRLKEDLVRELTEAKMHLVPSRLHFFLMRVHTAQEWQRRLLEHKILVRDCTSFGLPDFVRIATQRAEENVRLVQVVMDLRELERRRER
jgi:histidinol-phosphate aminotransferase